uniref:Uncharacterized protein LOC105649701 n=1 Tax=Rhizophora mucronata TaxID=61149 RepID=A0A2P2MDL0_RHIMU
MVENVGMKNLIDVVKESVGLQNGKLLFGCEGNTFKDLPWGALDDVVMGGVSQSTFQIDTTGGEHGEPTGLFKGVVSTANNGGFTSVRTRNFSVPEDLSAYDGLGLYLKGDGRRYKFIVRTSHDWDTVGYTIGFDTEEGHWQSICLPFSSLRPIFRARTVLDAPPFDPRNIVSLQLMFSKFEYDGKLNPTFAEGAFQLPVSSIRAYIKDPKTPRSNFFFFFSLNYLNLLDILRNFLLFLGIGLCMSVLQELHDQRGLVLISVSNLLQCA